MAVVPGAQTERRGGAGPVSILFRDLDSPAPLLLGVHSRQGGPWRVGLVLASQWVVIKDRGDALGVRKEHAAGLP
jgi:hypothetical protein